MLMLTCKDTVNPEPGRVQRTAHFSSLRGRPKAWFWTVADIRDGARLTRD